MMQGALGAEGCSVRRTGAGAYCAASRAACFNTRSPLVN